MMADVVKFEDLVRFEVFGESGVRTVWMRPEPAEIDLQVGETVTFTIETFGGPVPTQGYKW